MYIKKSTFNIRLTIFSYLLLLYFNLNAFAHPLEDEARKMMPPKDKCVVGFALSPVFHYGIVKKFDKHHYEITGYTTFHSLGTTVNLHALLETTNTTFGSTGGLNNIWMKNVGIKEMKLENGFSTKVDLWKECNGTQEGGMFTESTTITTKPTQAPKPKKQKKCNPNVSSCTADEL